ncbi:MAG: response regulator [Gemmiger sp.]|nr:response regulator [Gemmiger sp.]
MYKLMIVDDEAAIRQGMARSIPWAAWGYEITALCSNGQEAVEMLEEAKPDVVLSDIRMPKMDGVELMQYLNKNYPAIKIVILSGYSDFEYLNMSIKSQVAEYLLKPTDVDDFEALFKKLYARMEAERQQNRELRESVYRHFVEWLDGLLKGCVEEEDNRRFLAQAESRGICFANAVLMMLTVDERAGDEEKSLHTLKREITQHCNAQGKGVFLLTSEEEIVGICSLPAGQSLPPETVADWGRQLQQSVRAAFPATVSVGVSGHCAGLEALPQALEQAKRAANQNLFYGNESVFCYSELAVVQPERMAYFDTETIQKGLLAGDYPLICGELARVFARFTGAPVREYEFVDRICLSLLFHVSLWSLQYDVYMEELLRGLGTTYTDVLRCDTLKKKQDFVQALLFSVQRQIAQRRGRARSSSIADQIRHCVDEDFSLNAMSLEYVAEKVRKNAAYVSKIFKNEIGCNFSDYLTHKRLEKALSLLSQPEYKVYQIAQECGYADVSNFIKIFKKNYGISPNEYRTTMGVNA